MFSQFKFSMGHGVMLRAICNHGKNVLDAFVKITAKYHDVSFIH